MTKGFLKQKKLFSQVDDKLDDCLISKITFILALTKFCSRPQGKLLISLNMFDPILHFPVAGVLSLPSTLINICLSPLRSPDLATLTLELDS